MAARCAERRASGAQRATIRKARSCTQMSPPPQSRNVRAPGIDRSMRSSTSALAAGGTDNRHTGSLGVCRLRESPHVPHLTPERCRRVTLEQTQRPTLPQLLTQRHDASLHGRNEPLDPKRRRRASCRRSAGTWHAPDTSTGDCSTRVIVCTASRVTQILNDERALTFRRRQHLQRDLREHSQRAVRARHQLRQVIAGDVLHHLAAGHERLARAPTRPRCPAHDRAQHPPSCGAAPTAPAATMPPKCATACAAK